MPLEDYRRRRDFGRSPEPRGDVRAKSGPLSFVIQKHAARRLHYDLRLELDGVLKSWACPKGPSLDPSQKRLAVRVEDHPLEYAAFEGTIPAGEYGAGTVEIWDEGTWTPASDPHEALDAGKLLFSLDGKKLHGMWALVHMRGRDSGDKQNWLLIKERDEYVRREASSIPGARKAEIPSEIAPQLATLTAKAPEADGWLHEIKLDGYRIACRIEDGSVRLITRRGNDWTDKMRALVTPLGRLQARQAILDGEVVVLNPDGVSSFELLQGALSAGRDADLVYFVFDLLYLDGYDLRDCTLVERKRALASLVSSSDVGGAVRYTDHVSGRGESFHLRACEFALEGVVSKRADGVYHSGRGRDWLKVKCLQRQEFVIGGFTEPTGSRAGFGALLVGVHNERGELLYAGRVGTGFDEHTLTELSTRLAKLERERVPFIRLPPGGSKGVHWVEPRLVAEVRFSNWTREGLLRQAAFLGLREDKAPTEVIREDASAGEEDSTRPERPTMGTNAKRGVEVGGVTITNPGRVLYPDTGATKLDLAEYYLRVVDSILPHLSNRPLALVRCPQGLDGECFFQKQAADDYPDSILRVPLEVDGEAVDYMTVDSREGLLYLIQLDTLEIHTWSSRADAIERPDRIVIDLDPGEFVTWSQVAEGAQLVRRRLGALGLTSFVKTSGGKGYHVVAPLVRRHGWPDVEEFARAFAGDMVRQWPDRFTATQSKERRRGKTFVDYMRTHRGATTVAAYSTRARAGAHVSVPIGWNELSRGIRPDAFSIANAGERLDRIEKDPWDEYNRLGQSITQAMWDEIGAMRPSSGP